jgi:1,4-alpha-glucan branching enzyme
MGKTMIDTLRILDIDPWLKPFEKDLQLRMERYQALKKVLLGSAPTFSDFANGHLYFGIHRTKTGWVYREWAPAARALYLTGDFNNWGKTSHPLTRINNGCWEIQLEYEKYKKTFTHGSLVKVRVVSDKGTLDRIPIYIRRVVQDATTKDFSGQLWFPEEFRWTDFLFKPKQSEPIIYEAHIGMALEKEGIGTYREFADEVLPRIIKGGYNTLQLMAIMEHPYYGSFGYQVSNFFAPSSRFGTPEDLKYLINKAHLSGITVLLDLVHSHAVKNIAEGLNEFDGTPYQFFHDGPQGEHSGWDSKLFNYGKPEVLHFLLSNIKYWITEFHFDGFRFDGVTSMLYHHHGLGTAFDNYNKYFSMDTDIDAVTYLQFATELTHELKPTAITIAEDMSGMPGMCLPIADGGIGFDYRLSMGIPDYWIKTLKHVRDEDWDLWGLWHELTTRRPQEKVIGYAESHDQALVGDKTIAFWLMDKEMYWHMKKDDASLVIERGIALHKLIRLLTATLGGNGYLNFIGN